MKVIYLGVVHMRGTSKTGSQYDFAQLKYARTIKPVSNDKRTLLGFGVEEQVLSMDPTCLPEFGTVKPFTSVDVKLEPNPENPNQNQVVGLVS